MAKWVFLNNDFVEDEKATLLYRDLSFQRGYGVFDFFRLIGTCRYFWRIASTGFSFLPGKCVYRYRWSGKVLKASFTN